MTQAESISGNFYVYKITNIENNKIYIGKSGGKKNRWKQHLSTAKFKFKKSYSYLHKSINKHGADKFVFEIVKFFENEDDAYVYEAELIKQYNSTDKNLGMNLLSGGSTGSKHSKESIEKIRQWHLGYKFSEESIQKMRDSHLGQSPSNRKFDDETVRLIKETYINQRTLKVKNVALILSEKYNCSIHCINAIVCNIHYKHVKPINLISIPQGFKVCSVCNKILQLNEFNLETRSEDNHCGRCKICEAQCTKIRMEKRIATKVNK